MEAGGTIEVKFGEGIREAIVFAVDMVDIDLPILIQEQADAAKDGVAPMVVVVGVEEVDGHLAVRVKLDLGVAETVRQCQAVEYTPELGVKRSAGADIVGKTHDPVARVVPEDPAGSRLGAESGHRAISVESDPIGRKCGPGWGARRGMSAGSRRVGRKGSNNCLTVSTNQVVEAADRGQSANEELLVSRRPEAPAGDDEPRAP
ncbi:hypothetical protein K2173_019545 [Erythroxylum novogranatense]|uniref:Uncharacterized protein n=1 Tax=Erythroxylum novogranatense TaxID=1862640 RepID=A0AAV8UF28_9ROSI|nr:hypothetical protein K2173_019545 [Erythroxylum novogranatense]